MIDIQKMIMWKKYLTWWFLREAYKDRQHKIWRPNKGCEVLLLSADELNACEPPTIAEIKKNNYQIKKN